MASIAAFVYFWSSAYEVSGGCATDTLYPSLLRMLATGSQPEPSAKAPCTRTTFLTCCFTTILLCSKDPLGPGDLVGVCGAGSLFDELGCLLRMRHVRHMAGAVYFNRLGMGALRHHALLVRIDRPVCRRHHVPGGLGFPRGICDLVGERVGGDRHLRHGHKGGLVRWNVRREVRREVSLFDPPVTIAVGLDPLGSLR